MSNIQLSGESILGVQLADLKAAEEMAAKGELSETYGFWAQGEGYTRIYNGIEAKEEGFYDAKTCKSFHGYFKSLGFILKYPHATSIVKAYSVVNELKELGVGKNDLPRRLVDATMLLKHDLADRQGVWNEFLKTGDTKTLQLEAKPNKPKTKSSNDLLVEMNKAAKTLLGGLEIIEKLINKGIKPAERNKAVRLTVNLRQLEPVINRLVKNSKLNEDE